MLYGVWFDAGMLSLMFGFKCAAMIRNEEKNIVGYDVFLFHSMIVCMYVCVYVYVCMCMCYLCVCMCAYVGLLSIVTLW